jgi:hypothetical protein
MLSIVGTPKRRSLVICGLLTAILSTTALIKARTAEPAGGAALATSDQLAAETVVIDVLADPAVKAAEADVRRTLLADPVAKTPEGLARLDHAINEWTASLAFKEIYADTVRPRILWVTDDTPHTWFGHTLEGAAIAGDNPDHIYRATLLDGAGRYEITGHVAPNRPAQFSFEVTRGTPPGGGAMKNQTANHADMGYQIAMLTDLDIQVGPDGVFHLLLDGEPADGTPNHAHLEPGLNAVNIRDVLSDWRQKPNQLEIRRLDTPASPAPAPTEADIARRVAADLPGFVGFWSKFKDTWLGGIKPNTIVGPIARDGGWGYLAGSRFDLAPDEAAVVNVRKAGAAYIGLQATDLWMVAPDARLHQTSLNTSQVTYDADGSVTYVVAAHDPGVANWIDTGGLRAGYFLIRWEGFPRGAKPDGLLRTFKVVKIADLPGSLPHVTAEGRQAQLAERVKGYANRLVE